MLSRTLLIDRALASEGLVGLRAVEVVAHLGAGPVARHVAPCDSTARLQRFRGRHAPNEEGREAWRPR